MNKTSDVRVFQRVQRKCVIRKEVKEHLDNRPAINVWYLWMKSSYSIQYYVGKEGRLIWRTGLISWCSTLNPWLFYINNRNSGTSSRLGFITAWPIIHLTLATFNNNNNLWSQLLYTNRTTAVSHCCSLVIIIYVIFFEVLFDFFSLLFVLFMNEYVFLVVYYCIWCLFVNTDLWATLYIELHTCVLFYFTRRLQRIQVVLSGRKYQ